MGRWSDLQKGQEMSLALVLDVMSEQPKVYATQITNFKDFYPCLKCRTFTVVTCKIGESITKYDLYMDDESLLKENVPPLSGVSYDYNPLFYGNIVIGRHDSEGEMISLTPADLAVLRSYIVTSEIIKTGKKYPILVDIRY